MAETAELVEPSTLRVVDGEVLGGVDGKVWVATFASPIAAEHFRSYCVYFEKTFAGLRR